MAAPPSPPISCAGNSKTPLKGGRIGPTFESAHQGRSPVQAGAEATAGHTADHKGRTGYGGLPRRGSCCTRKDRTAEGTQVGKRGDRHGDEKELQIMPLDQPQGVRL